MLHASPAVITAWLAWRQTPPTDASDPSLLLAWERFILAIRADLGHEDKELPVGDITRLYVDIAEFDATLSAWHSARLNLKPGDQDQAAPSGSAATEPRSPVPRPP
jgi:hypothetical protein